jgi:SAM-dependent methyltransferase
MAENNLPQPHRSGEEIARASSIEYGNDANTEGTSMPAILRLLNYKTARSHNPDYDDPRWHDLHITDIHHIQAEYLYRLLGISTTASILDIGCGDGSGLLNHAMNRGHTGDLVGVNLSSASFFYGEQRAAAWEAEERRKAEEEGKHAELPNIRFFKGNAMDLPAFLKQGRFNVVKLDFILYHLRNPQKAIDEALEALDNEGFLVVSTRGEDNMELMWKENLPKVGKKLDAAAPLTFYADYTIEQLEEDMAERGLVCRAEYRQKEPMDITLAALDIYALTHSILNNHFRLHEPTDLGNGNVRPTPTFERTSKAVDEVLVKPVREKMMKDPNYVLQDKVNQVFKIYQRPKRLFVPRRRIILPKGAI